VFGIALIDAVWTMWQDRSGDQWRGPEQLDLSAKASIAAAPLPDGMQVFGISPVDAIDTVWKRGRRRSVPGRFGNRKLSRLATGSRSL
jgi:hypothetical protein